MTHSTWKIIKLSIISGYITFRALLFLSVVMMPLSSAFCFQPPSTSQHKYRHPGSRETGHTSPPKTHSRLIHVTQDIVLFWFISGLTFTIRSQDSQSCTIKKRRSHSPVMLLQKCALSLDCVADMKGRGGFESNTTFTVHWNCEEEVVVRLLFGFSKQVSQQFPPHFLLSTKHPTALCFHC